MAGHSHSLDEAPKGAARRAVPRGEWGFTIAELLIVVAIVGVLVAIAIPVFTSSLESAKEATCTANLTSSRHALVTSLLTSGGKLPDSAITDVMTQTMGAEASGSGFSGLCPDGGVYTVAVEGSQVSVMCSKHGASPQDVVRRDESVQKLLQLAIDKYFNVPRTTGLDSTGPNFGGTIRFELANDLGIPEDSFNFRVWRQRDGSGYIVYVFDNLAARGVAAGDTIDAVQYTYDKDGKLTKTTAGSAPVMSKTEDGNTYLVLKADEFKTT